MAEEREPIEDYCIRAGQVHPWALEAGTTIKAVKSEKAALQQRVEELERERVEAQAQSAAAEARAALWRDEYMQTNSRYGAATEKLAAMQVNAGYYDSLEQECDQLRQRANATENEVCQILGKALGYPWYKDDPENFPEATEADGVCVGDHTAASLAAEAAQRLAEMEAVVAELKNQRERLEQMENDYQQGMPERRLAEDLLDALDVFEKANVARGE